MYPPPLQDLIDLFAGLPETERREMLINMADTAPLYAPAEGETFDLEDIRKDEECTDTVGVFLTAAADGTFKSAEELRDLYAGTLGLKTDDDIVAYCRIGERSSHTWFVLKYLLGYQKVRNYDGSWTEWGNMVRSPIERS